MAQNRFSFTDLVVSLVLLIILAGYCLAVVVGADDVQSRVLCQKNLRMIGQALLLYANENKGAYPRAVADLKDKATPTWGTPYLGDEKLGPSSGKDAADAFAKDDSTVAQFKPKPNDVTAAFFLLIRTQEIPVNAFVCPATLKEPWDFGGGTNTALNWTNWNGAKGLRDHLSYSYQNPYPSHALDLSGYRLNSLMGGEFAVAADMNPGSDVLTKLTARSDPAALQRGNSPNHSREGQNVLFGDGHVEFQRTPFCGPMVDNIYTYGHSGQDRGGDGIVGAQVDANDSIVLPTALDIGAADKNGDFVEPVKPRELSRTELLEIQHKLVGKYASQDFEASTFAWKSPRTQ